MLAPDTRMSARQCGLNPSEWRRCEAIGAHEIDRLSKILSRQEWEKKKRMTVGQHLRENAFIEQVKVRCKLRMAQAHSANDVSINKQILDKIERRKDTLIHLITSDFDYTKRNTALAMELGEESTSILRNFGKKREGVQ